MKAGVVVCLVLVFTGTNDQEREVCYVIGHHITHVGKIVFVRGYLPALTPKSFYFQIVILSRCISLDRYE
jgi:hypothetical protein